MKKRLVSIILLMTFVSGFSFRVSAEGFNISLLTNLNDLSEDAVIEFSASGEIDAENIENLVFLKDGNGNEVDAEISVSGNMLSITPEDGFDLGTVYNITFHDAFSDCSGNVISGQKSFNVQTAYPTEEIIDIESPFYADNGGNVSVSVKGYAGKKSKYSVTWATFTPDIPAGEYKVYYWAVDYATSGVSEVQTEMYVNGETVAGNVLDLAAGRGSWCEVGSFRFAGTGDEYFKIYAPERVCCAKFEYVKSEEEFSFEEVIYPENLSSVSTELDITLRFSDGVDLSGFNGVSIGEENATLTAYAKNKTDVLIKTNTPLKTDTEYEIEISGIADLLGNQIPEPVELTVKTRDYSATTPKYMSADGLYNITAEVTGMEDAVLLSCITDENGYVLSRGFDELDEAEPGILSAELTKESGIINSVVLKSMESLCPVNDSGKIRTIELSEKSADLENGIVKIGGNVSEAIEDSFVIIVMLERGGKDITAENIKYISCINLSDTEFETEIILPDNMQGGAYDIYAGGTGIENPEYYDFYYITDETILKAKEDLNAATDTAAVADILENCSRELLLDDEFYGIFMEFSEAENDEAYVSVLNTMLEADFENTDEAKRAFSRSVMLNALKLSDSAKFKDFIERRGDVLDIYLDDKEYPETALVLSKYKTIDDASPIYINLPEFETEEELKFALEQSYAICLLDAATWGEIPGILSEYNKYFKLDLTKLTSSMEQTVARAMSLMDLSDLNKIISGYDEALKSASSSSSRPTGGGGGGGKGSSVTTSTAVSNVMVPDTTGEKADAIFESDVSEKTVSFSDIEDIDWAKTAIEELAAMGIISGYNETTFGPNDPVTREQFVKILVNAFDVLNLESSSDFADVSKEEWSYYYISSAVELGIIKGVSDTEFGYGKNITRQEMAVMLVRAMDVLDKSLTQSRELINFKDAPEISKYAVDAIEAIYKSGLMSGVGDECFDPQGIATRAMAAKVIRTAMDM